MSKLAPALVLAALVGLTVGSAGTAHPLTAGTSGNFNPAAILDPLQVEAPSVGLGIHPATAMVDPVLSVAVDAAWMATLQPYGWVLLPGPVTDPDGGTHEPCMVLTDDPSLIACSDGSVLQR